MRHVIFTAAVLTVVLAPCAAANAALVYYTDRAAWAAAAGSIVTDNLDSLTAGAFPRDTSVATTLLTITRHISADYASYSKQSSVSLAVSSIDASAIAVSISGTGAIWHETHVTINSGPVAAIGMDTVASHQGMYWDYPLFGFSVNQAEVADPPLFTHFSVGSGFIGVIDDTGAASISSLEVMGLTNFTAGAFDNISWSVTPVPEPATMSLLAMGSLAALIRRRK